MTREFARHYAEMPIVMLVGMAMLAVPARLATSALIPSLDPNDPSLMLARMGLIMALPMVPWMRWRGHGWRPCSEMAAAMIVTAIGVIVICLLGVNQDLALLMTIEHVTMFVAMFLAMAGRPEEYSERCQSNRSPATFVVSQR